MSSIAETVVKEIFCDCPYPVVFFNIDGEIHWKNRSFEMIFADPAAMSELKVGIRNWLLGVVKDIKIRSAFLNNLTVNCRVYPRSKCNNSEFILRTEIFNLFEEGFKLVKQEIINQKNALDHAAIVAITDPLGIITYANDKFLKISGYTRDEILGQSHRMINSGFHSKSFFVNMWRTISLGRVWHGEIRNRRKDGEFYWVDTTIVPILDQDKKISSYISIRFDISERISQLQEIEDGRMRLIYAEKMASLGELAAGIAHELGNPLASVSAWLDVVSSAIKTGRVNDVKFYSAIDNVKEKVNRMSRILKGMLSYARDGSCDPSALVDLVAVLHSVLDYCSLKLLKCGIVVKLVNFPKSLICNCRETEISQVLVNLILNACDAVCDLPERWIEARFVESGDFFIISIVDSGGGISPEMADQIMKPFFTTKKFGKGTGMGLSISKEIMERTGGSLSLDYDSPNTKFDMRLPRKGTVR